MKYLKIFEEWNCGDLYTQISEAEYRRLSVDYENHSRREENISDIDKIKNLLDTNDVKFYTRPFGEDIVKWIYIWYKPNRSTDWNIEVTMVNDDWYLVKVLEDNSNWGEHDYYKCDQYEGLIEFLKDLKVIK